MRKGEIQKGGGMEWDRRRERVKEGKRKGEIKKGGYGVGP